MIFADGLLDDLPDNLVKSLHTQITSLGTNWFNCLKKLSGADPDPLHGVHWVKVGPGFRLREHVARASILIRVPECIVAGAAGTTHFEGRDVEMPLFVRSKASNLGAGDGVGLSGVGRETDEAGKPPCLDMGKTAAVGAASAASRSILYSSREHTCTEDLS